ncbi:TonB-dependent receptor plug domain-containing protein [Aquabacterium sp. OR-4]|uniref:TonB-dependent receptor plug domain-containing protein n=1 Tax=Aquabacterium sp. OR-4 TaxID=2978127 RepID=UPI0021B26673|nr:TonB-dependent receptor [Aquabacterium sp. OR-4]MDT7833832.1 TonB-dependent receptor [Aquabacterium sp. OR-4]
MAAVLAACAQAAPPPAAEAAPAELSLEDLLKADVVTASRKAQAVQDVAAAVYVISREDIERSGASSLPAALALAPGVEVQRLSSGRWAVGTRGFSGRFANKLLVLMDGRSIYSPLFSGVLWEMEGTLIEDIERIEVIRGPGAALWGANAVNGVINILTRPARNTQGTLLAAGTGTLERSSLALRHGGTLGGAGGSGLAGASGHWRAWFSHQDATHFDDLSGAPANDDWHTTRAGFRADLTLAGGTALSLSGSLSDNSAGDRWYTANLVSATGSDVNHIVQRTNTAHLLARANLLGSDGSETVVQSYLATDRISGGQFFDQHRATVDVDVQHRPRPLGAHDLVLGATWRTSRDRVGSGPGLFSFRNPKRNFTVASVFVNDEITLLPQTLRATVGARIEHNSFTGWEPQPHLRLAWTPNPTQTLWGAASRAVRTPSRAERDIQVDLRVTPASPPVPPVLLRSTTHPDQALDAERVVACELGFRQQFGPSLALDLALFSNRYTQLTGGATGAQSFEFTPVPHVVQYLTPGNHLHGRTRGGELVLDWRVLRGWRVQAMVSLVNTHVGSNSSDPVTIGSALSQAGGTPERLSSLRSTLALGSQVDVDARLRHASAISATGVKPVPAYTTLDLRLAWRARPGLTLSLMGENLLQRRHVEGAPELLPSPTLQVPRSGHVKALWQF